MSVTNRLLDAEYEDAPHFINPDYEDALVGVTDDGRVVYDFDKMVEYLVNKEAGLILKQSIGLNIMLSEAFLIWAKMLQ